MLHDAKAERIILSYIRWLAIIGQSIAILVSYYVIGIDFPVLTAFVFVALSVAVNIFALSERASFSVSYFKYLLFDIIQLSALIAVCGGIENPFSILIIAPVVVAVAILDTKRAFISALIAVIFVTVITFFYYPIDWNSKNNINSLFPSGNLPALYRFGFWFALCFSVLFIAYYMWRIVDESRNRAKALDVMNEMISRHRRISALGVQATATAHELGSPLNTIAIISQDIKEEISKQSKNSDYMIKDLDDLNKEVARCKDIINKFSSQNYDYFDQHDRLSESVSLNVYLSLLAQKYEKENSNIKISIIGEEDENNKINFPDDITIALGNLLQNATQFAKTRVTITYAYENENAVIKITDDGEGFPDFVLKNIGRAGISLRNENQKSTAVKNMGLGIFTAVFLIESHGGEVRLYNDKMHDKLQGACAEIILTKLSF